MTPLRLALMLLCLLAWSTGCRMCASNYDYCGPTVSGECGGDCGPECGICAPREGSILTGVSHTVYEEGMAVPHAMPTPAEPVDPDQLGLDDFEAPIMPSQIVQGERIDGVIISVEDRTVEDRTVEDPPAQAIESTASSQGWEARR